jgi:hypothetical protein
VPRRRLLAAIRPEILVGPPLPRRYGAFGVLAASVPKIKDAPSLHGCSAGGQGIDPGGGTRWHGPQARRPASTDHRARPFLGAPRAGPPRWCPTRLCRKTGIALYRYQGGGWPALIVPVSTYELAGPGGSILSVRAFFRRVRASRRFARPPTRITRRAPNSESFEWSVSSEDAWAERWPRKSSIRGVLFRRDQRRTTSPAWTRASTSARVTASTSLRAERRA